LQASKKTMTEIQDFQSNSQYMKYLAKVEAHVRQEQNRMFAIIREKMDQIRNIQIDGLSAEKSRELLTQCIRLEKLKIQDYVFILRDLSDHEGNEDVENPATARPESVVYEFDELMDINTKNLDTNTIATKAIALLYIDKNAKKIIYETEKMIDVINTNPTSYLLLILNR
jgi:hypothetical protein